MRIITRNSASTRRRNMKTQPLRDAGLAESGTRKWDMETHNRIRGSGLAESDTSDAECENDLQMKVISAISIAMLALGTLFTSRGYSGLTQQKEVISEETVNEEISDFEKAVQIIKKYETLPQPRHYPLVGYGHLVQPGEKYSRTKAMNEKDADALLRKDLLKNCAVFRSYGPDSLILGVLAYNIGSGATLRSSVAKKLKNGDRNIYENYIAHCRYRGKPHSQIKQRRIEEFETLFIKELPVEKNEIKEATANGESEAMLFTPGFISPARWYDGAHDDSPGPISGIVYKLIEGAITRFPRLFKLNYHTSNTQTSCITRSPLYCLR